MGDSKGKVGVDDGVDQIWSFAEERQRQQLQTSKLRKAARKRVDDESHWRGQKAKRNEASAGWVLGETRPIAGWVLNEIRCAAGLLAITKKIFFLSANWTHLPLKALDQNYARNYTESPTGGECSQSTFLDSTMNSSIGCAICKPNAHQCPNGLFCFAYADFPRWPSKCRWCIMVQ